MKTTGKKTVVVVAVGDCRFRSNSTCAYMEKRRERGREEVEKRKRRWRRDLKEAFQMRLCVIRVKKVACLSLRPSDITLCTPWWEQVCIHASVHAWQVGVVTLDAMHAD